MRPGTKQGGFSLNENTGETNCSNGERREIRTYRENIQDIHSEVA